MRPQSDGHALYCQSGTGGGEKEEENVGGGEREEENVR